MRLFMNKKRFNDYQCPKQFMTYMSRLEDKRRTIASDDHYVLQNAELLKKYRRAKSESARDKIKDTLFWVNLKFLHEIFMKKLNPNLFKSDILDIYQELCISLTEGINKTLAIRNSDTNMLSNKIWSRLMTGVDRVIKEYYERGNYFEELEDPDVFEYEYPESYEVPRTLYRYLWAREEAIIEELYFRDKELDETGDRFGLTRERVRQIREKAIKKMRQASEEVSEESDIGVKCRKDIFKILHHYPKVRWIVFEDPDQVTVDLEYLEIRGINPKQFLVISSSKPIGESYYNRVQYDSWIPRQYYGNVFDLTLEAVTYNRIQYPYQYDILREIKKIGSSRFLTEPQLRSIAIKLIYQRELQV